MVVPPGGQGQVAESLPDGYSLRGLDTLRCQSPSAEKLAPELANAERDQRTASYDNLPTMIREWEAETRNLEDSVAATRRSSPAERSPGLGFAGWDGPKVEVNLVN
jgi:hypothetical protein